MEKIALLCAVIALILTGCGDTANANASDETKDTEQTSVTASAKTEKQTETDADNSEKPAADYSAGASAGNIYGGKIQGLIPDGNGFYEYVTSAMENGEECFTVYDPKTLTVHFKSGNDKCSLSLCYDNAVAFTENYNTKYYTISDEEYSYIRDTAALYSSLGVIFEGKDFTISEEKGDDTKLEAVFDDIPDVHREVRYYYGDEKRTRLYDIEINGEYAYYSQSDYTETDTEVDGEPYGTTVNFYEFFTNGKESFSRPNKTDVYFPAETFEGDAELLFLKDTLISGSEKCYTSTVTADGADYTLEVRSSEDTMYYALIKDNVLSAEWEYVEGVGVRLMEHFLVEDSSTEELDKTIEHAKEHLAEGTGKTTPSTDRAEWVREDTEKYGLFDLLQPIERGEDCEPTGVVEEWREYISSGNPYTLEYRWTGALRNEYEIDTTDGVNYYNRHDMELHEADHDNLGSEEWFVDGRLFQSIYELDKYDSKEVTEYPPSEFAVLSCDLLFENEDYNENYHGECVKAYKVTIGGEEYVCEEWSLYLGRKWKVYIKDGNIVAWVGDFYNEDTFNTVIRLEKQGDPELIRIPENSKEYVSND